MESIGKTLREARESLGLTLEEVERATRIRAVRLDALENGEFESLPSRAQVRGFLRNYADYLGLNPDEILQRLAQGETSQSGRTKRSRTTASPSTPAAAQRPPRRLRIYGDQIITAGVAFAVITLLVWGSNRILLTLNQPVEPTVVSTETSPAPTQLPTSTAQLIGEAIPPAEVTQQIEASVTPTLPLGLVERIELEILAEQSTFVQVIADGQEQFQGRMLAGDRLSFIGEDRVEVITGNGRGLRVFFNGQDQGLMGQVNQVITRVWTIRGMQTPTPTQTLTPTASPPATETPTPTITQVGG